MATQQQSFNRAKITARAQEVAKAIDQSFLDKQEIIRLMLIALISGEHLVLIGPPGTAKSALVRRLAQLIDARYFEYLLTRFTEPNELFGPVDMKAFREGRYQRNVAGMLPQAEIVFLDEVFKANSAILNSLLTLLNERRYANGSHLLSCPLLSAFGASNEVPNEEGLTAIFDRFMLRVRSENLDSFHFNRLIEKGVAHELSKLAPRGATQPIMGCDMLRAAHGQYASLMQFTDEFMLTYKGLIFQLRSEGVSISDRRVVKLTKLFAASALFDGRPQPGDGDLFIIKHIWNNLEQADLISEIVSPVLERHYREHPEQRSLVGKAVELDDLLSELNLIRDLLTGGKQLSDIQLFSQLKNLNEIKAALQGMDGPAAQRMVGQVEQLLDSVFASSRFA